MFARSHGACVDGRSGHSATRGHTAPPDSQDAKLISNTLAPERRRSALLHKLGLLKPCVNKRRTPHSSPPECQDKLCLEPHIQIWQQPLSDGGSFASFARAGGGRPNYPVSLAGEGAGSCRTDFQPHEHFDLPKITYIISSGESITAVYLGGCVDTRNGGSCGIRMAPTTKRSRATGRDGTNTLGWRRTSPRYFLHQIEHPRKP
jgi:hypothetical protein